MGQILDLPLNRAGGKAVSQQGPQQMKGSLMKLLSSIALCALLTTGTLLGQTSSEKKGPGKLWWGSVAAVIAASSVDAHSSWGRQELNPVLRDSNGRFAVKGVALKAAIAGGVVAAQWFMMRRNPKAAKYAAVTNFGMASLFGYVAIHNYGLGAKPAAPVEPARPDYLVARPSAPSFVSSPLQ